MIAFEHRLIARRSQGPTIVVDSLVDMTAKLRPGLAIEAVEIGLIALA